MRTDELELEWEEAIEKIIEARREYEESDDSIDNYLACCPDWEDDRCHEALKSINFLPAKLEQAAFDAIVYGTIETIGHISYTLCRPHILAIDSFHVSEYEEQIAFDSLGLKAEHRQAFIAWLDQNHAVTISEDYFLLYFTSDVVIERLIDLESLFEWLDEQVLPSGAGFNYVVLTDWAVKK